MESPLGHNAAHREHARVPLAVPLEIHTRNRTGPPIIGLVENLSAGGLLAVAREPLGIESELAMLFTLPTGEPIRAFGRVIYARGSSRYGIRFIDLGIDALQQVQQFTHKVLGYSRRSSRVPYRTRLVLRSSPTAIDLEEAETVLVSRNGGLLICRGTYRTGQELYIWSPERNRGAKVRVIYEQVWEQHAVVELGFEFIEPAQSFWGVAF